MSADTPTRLLDLLARAHGDGGHHTDEVGLEQSTLDAHRVVARLRAQAVEDTAAIANYQTALDDAQRELTAARMVATANDVEVERLTAALADEEGAHARTADNFEQYVAMDEVERITAERDEQTKRADQAEEMAISSQTGNPWCDEYDGALRELRRIANALEVPFEASTLKVEAARLRERVAELTGPAALGAKLMHDARTSIHWHNAGETGGMRVSSPPAFRKGDAVNIRRQAKCFQCWEDGGTPTGATPASSFAQGQRVVAEARARGREDGRRQVAESTAIADPDEAAPRCPTCNGTGLVAMGMARDHCADCMGTGRGDFDEDTPTASPTEPGVFE